MENKVLEIKRDSRGDFIEVFKVVGFGQVSFCTAKPGVTRGEHYHTRKKETFCVIAGEAIIRQRDKSTGTIEEKKVSGESPELVEMKINWPHSIKNIGDNEMKFIIWISEIYDPNDPDTYPEKV